MADEGARAAGEEQLVLFDLGREAYGIDIASVEEIIRMQEITRVPRAPRFVEGVINLRGKVIPVVDLRQRFGLEPASLTRSSRIVVVDIGEQTVGMVVDAVSEVLRVQQESVEPPSPLVTTVDSGYLRGIARLGDRLVILLDLERILSSQQIQAVEAVA